MVDKAVEGLARAFARRAFLKKMAAGAFGLAAAVAVGSVKTAPTLATHCTSVCNPPRNVCCSHMGYTCPTYPYAGCPSGCSICNKGEGCDSWCIYPSGWWISPGSGGCGVCYDCWCGGFNCSSNTCGCYSWVCGPMQPENSSSKQDERSLVQSR